MRRLATATRGLVATRPSWCPRPALLSSRPCLQVQRNYIFAGKINRPTMCGQPRRRPVMPVYVIDRPARVPAASGALSCRGFLPGYRYSGLEVAMGGLCCRHRLRWRHRFSGLSLRVALGPCPMGPQSGEAPHGTPVVARQRGRDGVPDQRRLQPPERIGRARGSRPHRHHEPPAARRAEGRGGRLVG